MEVNFEDFSIEVIDKLNSLSTSFLYEAAELLTSATKQLTKVRTGQLKGSWQYNVDDGSKTATIGSGLENAIWNEFGTGEFAVSGGRKGGWRYKDDKGNWHFTKGKRPRRTLGSAYESKKASIINRAETIFKQI